MTYSNNPKEMKKNDVTSFFFYMWNEWCEEECEQIFGECGLSKHFWNKWCYYHQKFGPSAGIAGFYAELNFEYQDMLVKRATELYDRRTKLK